MAHTINEALRGLESTTPEQLRAAAEAERFERMMKALLPEGWTFGYIGNVYLDGTDDRSWSIFVPHPGRVGTMDDRIGDCSTATYRTTLLALARGIHFGRKNIGR